MEARVSSGLPQAWATGSIAPGRRGVWHASSWRRSPSAPPKSPWVGPPQTGEQLYPRSSRTAAKVLDPTADFPTWGSSKGPEDPRESDFEGQWDLITNLPQVCRNREKRQDAVWPGSPWHHPLAQTSTPATCCGQGGK